MIPFAYAVDLADRWPAFVSTDEPRADLLLADASAILRRQVRDIDAQIDAQPDLAEIAKVIVVRMVKRAMTGPELSGGAEQMSTTVGPFSQSFQYTNPLGDLYVTSAELAMFSAARLGAMTVWVQ